MATPSPKTALAAVLTAGLVAAPFAALPAHAADPVDLNLLSINDFHGRIDANTVKFAGTVEQLRAQNPEGTLFTSAGDNIGASVFASSTQQDQPTIDVLNALELATTAVGNHEFDRGFADLTDRVAPASKYPQLGANVYRAGTTEPALPEYELVPVNGVTVGVVGVVTEETASLVSPGGIADLEFGDPVDAVNRVAAQLTDGAGDEADVIMASYHEGASTNADLASAVAASAVFNRIVNETSPDVDVIFNGHTHQAYSFDAPVPGADGKTRPVVQTGSYGANIGQVQLSYDAESDEVLAHTAAVVPRTGTADAELVSAYPRVAEVSSIVQAALDNAEEVGAQPVGSVTGDITTAFLPDGPDADTAPDRDDRGSESTLGNLVADSLLTSLASAERGGADIGVVNPGGLRNELYYAPDGTVTYAEANGVLPFLNNLWTTTLTGAQVKTLLEQQWQRTAAGEVPSRAYLQLGLSKNVNYTYDAALPEGERITGVWVNGEPLDPERGYRVGTFSFLAQGGDNFHVFTKGADTRDSGLVDRDAWIDYLQDNSPLSPDFARRTVQVTGAPESIGPGQQVSVQLARLDLTSLGAPLNTEVSLAYVDAAGTSTKLGTFPVADGGASIEFTAPSALDGGYFELSAAASGTTFRLPSAIEAGGSDGGDHVVINEAYLSGGSAGAAYTNKFIELYNPTDVEISLDGWSLQYRSAGGTGNPTGVAALSGSIEAGGHYLVQANSNGANGEELPEPDLVTSLAPSGTNGTLVLANQSGAVADLGTGSVVDRSTVVDLLGYGTSNTFETEAAQSPRNNTDVRSMNRADGTDTNNNAADFSLSQDITPQGSGEGNGGGDPEPEAATIAEIQGTGTQSPLAGKTVTTRGVVTAAYATGGFDGYYLQTEGTGGDTNTTDRTASDAVFVYSPETVGDVRVGDFVEVSGKVSEFHGLTEITVAAEGLTVLTEAAEAPKAAAIGWPATEAEREKFEGMLLSPQGGFTVTDNFALNQYGEIGLAAGDSALVQPTAVGAYGSDEFWAETEKNAALAVTLDDGSSVNYLGADANKDIPLPYLSAKDPVRVGSPATFATNVVLDYRFDLWRFQPLNHLTVENAESVQPVSFQNTRTDSPEQVGGVKLASFNVLNYFSTTGDQVAGCGSFTDRDGNPITARNCDARGAWDAENLERQQDKIVAAINALDADIVALEEIENSAQFGKDRDAALAALTKALNADLGDTRHNGKHSGKGPQHGGWDYVRSPDELPALADEDFIRTAFIYKKDEVKTVQESVIHNDTEAFANARKPLAQAFKAKNGPSDTFVVIANHFKSKGSGPNSGENADHGQGAWNAARTAQAHSLVDFAEQMQEKFRTGKVLLTGDFNSYAKEDPIKVLTEAGYVDQGAKTSEHSYSFGGMVGSLDYIFASPAADAKVKGADIWNINSVESIALEYSRYNYNATNFYAPDPFRASDHDPIIVGLDMDKDRGNGGNKR